LAYFFGATLYIVVPEKERQLTKRSSNLTEKPVNMLDILVEFKV